MFINNEKLSIEEKKLASLIDKYNDIVLNYYNILNESSVYWTSPLSIRFFSDIQQEKNKLNITISELKSIDLIYQYIIDTYSEFGKKINYDLSNEEKLTHSFNKYIERLDSIIILYKQFENNNSNYEIIQQHIDIINKNKSKMIEIKEYYVNTLTKIKEIEAEVKSRISNLKIDYIKETEFQQYL